MKTTSTFILKGTVFYSALDITTIREWMKQPKSLISAPTSPETPVLIQPSQWLAIVHMKLLFKPMSPFSVKM